MRFQRVRNEEIYFKDHIEQTFRGHPMPYNIKKQRNVAIILIAIQIVSALVSFVMYFRRRVSSFYFHDFHRAE